MTVSNAQPPAQPPGDAPRPSADYPTNTEKAAQSRRAAGMTERRETAPAMVQRPPDADPRIGQWLLVFFLVVLVISLISLVATRVVNPTFWETYFPLTPPQVQIGAPGSGATAAAPAANATVPAFVAVPPGFTLWLAEDFAQPSLVIPEVAIPNQLAGAVLPQEGIYRLDVWPQQIGWTIFDLSALPAYRFETSATLDAATPASAVGLVSRFQGAGNFYLFTVDGDGRVAAELWKDGRPFTLLPPTPMAVIRPTGSPNRLAVEDDGQQLRFFVNQALIFTVADPQLPPGRVGLAALSTGDQIGAAAFDWVAIYAPQ